MFNFSQLLARVRSTPIKEHVSIEGWASIETSDQKGDPNDDGRGKDGRRGTFIETWETGHFCHLQIKLQRTIVVGF